MHALRGAAALREVLATDDTRTPVDARGAEHVVRRLEGDHVAVFVDLRKARLRSGLVKAAAVDQALDALADGEAAASVLALDGFLANAGFDEASRTVSNESVEPNYEQVEGRNGNLRTVQEGHLARQSITLHTADIDKVIAASRAIVQFEADGHPVSYGDPQYLVSNLEEVKMSLIADAMKNSRKRAAEFAKNGDVEVTIGACAGTVLVRIAKLALMGGGGYAGIQWIPWSEIFAVVQAAVKMGAG